MKKKDREILEAAKIKLKYDEHGKLTLAPWDQVRLMAFRADLDDKCAEAKRKHQVLEDHIRRSEAGEEITEEQLNKAMNPIQRAPSEQHIPVSSEGQISDDEFNSDLAKTFVKKAHHSVDQQEELVNRVTDAKKALALSVETFRRDIIEFLDEMDKHLLRVRQTRMAMDSEVHHMLKACGDVRKFFLNPEHVEEVNRLKEFVGVCERLKALKDSGMLEAVSDTILKLGA